jgi:hypothetical protein
MTATAFDSSWLDAGSSWQAKFTRARQHLTELVHLAEDFRGSVTVTPEPTDTPGRIAHRLRYARPQPSEIGTAIGDVLHNQRGALENLAYELARRSQGGQLTPEQEGQTTFPICRDPDRFSAFFKDKRAGLYSDKAKSALRAAQPFVHLEQAIALGVDHARGYGDEFNWSSLHRLDKLWNVDKHRRLTVTAWWPDMIWWSSNGPSNRRAFRGDGTLEDGSVLIYTEGVDEGHGDRLNYDFNLVLTDDPAFSGDESGSTRDVVKLLEGFQEHIAWSVFNPVFSIMSQTAEGDSASTIRT